MKWYSFIAAHRAYTMFVDRYKSPEFPTENGEKKKKGLMVLSAHRQGH